MDDTINHQIAHAEYAEQVYIEVIDDICEAGAKTLYDHYIDSKTVPHTVQNTLALLGSFLEMKYHRVDEGEPMEWPEHKEPKISLIDTWGRSSIPVRKKIVHKAPAEPPKVDIEARSVRSVRTGLGRGLARGLGKLSTQMGSTQLESTLEEVQENIPQPIVEEIREIPEEEEKLRLWKDIEIKKKKEEEENLRKLKQQEDENMKKIARMQQDLKSKEFTYDHNGRIIMVQGIKFDKMPPAAHKVKYTFPEPEEAKKPARRPGMGQKPATAGAKLPTVRAKKAPVDEMEFVKNQNALQPPVYDVLVPAFGVTLKEVGGRVKTSQDQRKGRRLMTREEYLRQGDAQTKSHIGFGRSGVQESSMQSLIPEVDETHNLERTNEQGEPVNPSGADLLSAIPDIKDELGIDRMVRTAGDVIPEVTVTRNITTAQANRITQYDHGFPGEDNRSEIDKFNMKILHAADWGQNPAPSMNRNEKLSIKKPNARTQHYTHGLKAKNPRDRPNIERVGGRRTRAPPPKFGKTMVHGQEEPEEF